jgi:AcrR family transcriptional regulator
MTREQRADARRNRERLLEVAADAFAAHGVDASLEEIARRAGVGVGTLYRHFPSRDALIEAVFRRNVDQLMVTAEELAANKPPVEALDEFLSQFVSYVATKKGLATHLKSVLAADSEIFTYSHERMTAAITGLVEAAIADGSIRPDVEPMDVLRGISGVCLMADSADPAWQDQARRIAALIMDGLRYRAMSRQSS